MDVYTVKVLKPSGRKVWTSHRKGLKTLWKECMDIYSVKVLKPCGGEVLDVYIVKVLKPSGRKVWVSTP